MSTNVSLTMAKTTTTTTTTTTMMRLFPVVATLLVCLVSFHHVAAFSANPSQRIFVGTPVSSFPKHLVADRMSQDPKVLEGDLSVDEAIHRLVKWGVSGAPVVNKEGQLLGVISSFDFLQKEAFEGAVIPMEGTEEHMKEYLGYARKICGQRVKDIMTVNMRTVSPNTPMRVAAEIMATEKMHHLPVVDDHGHLSGILTPSDVMKDLVHVVQGLPQADDELADV